MQYMFKFHFNALILHFFLQGIKKNFQMLIGAK